MQFARGLVEALGISSVRRPEMEVLDLRDAYGASFKVVTGPEVVAGMALSHLPGSWSPLSLAAHLNTCTQYHLRATHADSHSPVS